VLKWYRHAATKGDVLARGNLGVMSVSGRGVAQDFAEAVKLLRFAGEYGDAQARDKAADVRRCSKSAATGGTPAVTLASSAKAANDPSRKYTHLPLSSRTHSRRWRTAPRTSSTPMLMTAL
jgi:TPR repeat protein